MDPDAMFDALVGGGRRRVLNGREEQRPLDIFLFVAGLAVGVAGVVLGLVIADLLSPSPAESRRNLDEKEMQLAKATADLLHREADLARAHLLWTQMLLADAAGARARPDFLGGGEAQVSPPVRSYGPAANAQPTSGEVGESAHPQGGGARQDACPSPRATGGARQGPGASVWHQLGNEN